jgi:DNA polymerase III subunit gamma/tau
LCPAPVLSVPVGSLADVALALYRKYRPAKFAEVVGQEHVTQPLSVAIEAGRINHAYLFSGPRGCGKTSSARILARSLNCELGPTPEPCGVCSSCVSLAPGGPGNIDVTELDAASHGGVDDTRELRDRAFFAPAESRYRVFIVDEAHMITTQGFNALLKIVEEPPEHLVFVFATTEPEKVLPTIRSRTHHYPFRLIPPGTLRKLLERICAEEEVTVAPAVYPLVIRAGGGSARDSLSVLDQLVAGAGPEGVTYERAVALLGVTDVSLIDDVVDALAAGDRAAVFEAVDRLVEAGHDPRRFAADLLQRLRDITLLQAVPEAVERGLVEAADDEIARMVEQSGKFGAATLTRYGEILHVGLTEMRGATAPRLLLELLCARMLLPAATTEEPGLLERLERLERRSAIAAGPPAPGEAGADGDLSAPAPAGDASGQAGGRASYSRKSAASGGTPSAPAASSAADGVLPSAAAASAAAGAQPAAAGAQPPAPAAGAVRATPSAAGGPPSASSAAGGLPPASAAGGLPPASATPHTPHTSSEAGGVRSAPSAVGGPPSAASAAGGVRPAAEAAGGSRAASSTEGGAPHASAAGGAPAAASAAGGPPPAASTADGRSPASSAKGGPSSVSSAASGAPPASASPAAAAAPPPEAGAPGRFDGPSARPPVERPASVGAADGSSPAAGDQVQRNPVDRPASAVGAADVRRVWQEIQDAVKQRKKRTAALLVSATVRAVENDTLVLAIGTAPLARLLSEQSNTDVIAEALHAVLGVRWRVRCEHGDAAAPRAQETRQAARPSSAGPPARASQAPGQPSGGASPSGQAPGGRPSAARASGGGASGNAGGGHAAGAGAAAAGGPPPSSPAGGARWQSGGRAAGRVPARDDGVPLPPEPAEEDTPPDDEEAMLAELDAGPSEQQVPVRSDPEEAAIALLTSQLGARAIDRR